MIHIELLQHHSGTTGLNGRDGLNIKGDKGDPGDSIKGDKGDPGAPAHMRKSAFIVIQVHPQTGDPGDVVTFQEATSNIGNHFNLATNRITCDIPGTYVFMFTIVVYQNIEIMIVLVKKWAGNCQCPFSEHQFSHFESGNRGSGLVAISWVWWEIGL